MTSEPWWYQRARAYVFVEDPLTKVMLDTAWGDLDLRVVSAGGAEAVMRMVRDAKEHHVATVFGVIDRDFSLKQGWLESGRVYQFERHEAENYLLDFATLGQLAVTPAEDIEREARAFAERVAAWMAARSIAWEINGALTANFPCVPSPGQEFTEAQAIRCLSDRTYWRALKDAVNQKWDGTGIAKEVAQKSNAYKGDLESDRWLLTFCGKELCQHLRGTFSRLGRGEPSDLARAVATRWRRGNTAPDELRDLHREIRKRAGLVSQA